MRIGILALQGDFAEHGAMLRQLGVQTREVRLPSELADLAGLVIPGGESTTMGRLARSYGLIKPIQELAQQGLPLWGTCAGMILLARETVDGVPGQPLLGLLDVTVVRNGFGRQLDSFEVDMEVPILGPPAFHGVFIRAPYIQDWAAEVQILARLEEGQAVAAQQGNRLVTAFHPELTQDLRFHRYFLQLVEQSA
ncbi:MAG: pyridoxal 5'-phosphate synthase glutaminase subunit PdxT [Chloroflexia bacterium]|nr:pyridoxal 5'-phosphate synthase glutaminase subunit PdxT [Chloroflexia bacterium]